jgi:hypothetical protein
MHCPLEIRHVQNIQVSATPKIRWKHCIVVTVAIHTTYANCVLSSGKHFHWNDHVVSHMNMYMPLGGHIANHIDPIKAFPLDHSWKVSVQLAMWLLIRLKYVKLGDVDWQRWQIVLIMVNLELRWFYNILVNQCWHFKSSCSHEYCVLPID